MHLIVGLCATLTKCKHIHHRFYTRGSPLSMGLQTGIVGLPNVGKRYSTNSCNVYILTFYKSTLFNALVGSETAQAANFPFCTIEPNIGIVSVPDSRLDILKEINKSERVVPVAVRFLPIKLCINLPTFMI
jgi:hypothetical protein